MCFKFRNPGSTAKTHTILSTLNIDLACVTGLSIQTCLVLLNVTPRVKDDPEEAGVWAGGKDSCIPPWSHRVLLPDPTPDCASFRLKQTLIGFLPPGFDLDLPVASESIWRVNEQMAASFLALCLSNE